MESADDEPILIDLDDRRRAYLTKVGRPEHRRYAARTEPDGTVILTPAVLMTVHDAALLQRPDILKAIQTAKDHPETLVRHSRPNLA